MLYLLNLLNLLIIETFYLCIFKSNQDECCKIIRIASESYELTSIYQIDALGLYLFSNVDHEGIMIYKKVEPDHNGNTYYIRGSRKYGWKVISAVNRWKIRKLEVKE